MFAKIAVALFTLVAVVTATGNVNQCNTGNAQCCNQVYQAKSAEAKKIAGNVVGLNVNDITGLVGAECTPLTIIGATVSGNCNSHAVCCTDNKQTGLVNVNCLPVSL